MSQLFQCLCCGGTYADTCADGIVYYHACPPLRADKDGAPQERPDRRDENMASPKPGRTAGIKAEGKGVVCLSKPDLEEPDWLSKVKARIAREEEA